MKIAKSSLAALGIAVVLAGGSLTAAEANVTDASKPRTTASQTHRPFNGEQVFRGAVFGQGPVGEKLRGLVPRMNDDSQTRAEIDAIITDIRTHDSGFLAQFAKQSQSGEIDKVQDAFDGAARAFNHSLERLGYNADAASASPNCIAVVLFAAAALVYAAVAVLQIGAVATMNVYANKNVTKSASAPTSDLAHDKWLARTTTALSGR